MNVLVTGGCGFIGSNLVRYLMAQRPGWRIVNLDLLTYAANPANLAGIEEGRRYRFVRGDVADRTLIAELFRRERFDAVIHCAAESHVDRPIHDSGAFLRTNLDGTHVLLKAALESGGVRHLQVSTDEVYGSLAPGDSPFTEDLPLRPRSPYSASKAAADLLCLAFAETYGMDVVVSRCSNNYGPYQHPEKLIPFMICSALDGEPLPVYGDGRQCRDWIYVEDHCRGLLAALEHGAAGEVYNFGGDTERENIDVVRAILDLTGGGEQLIRHVADRPGHDRRYAVRFAKAEADLGWKPSVAFEDALAATTGWYRDNREWWHANAAAARAESSERIRQWERVMASTAPKAVRSCP